MKQRVKIFSILLMVLGLMAFSFINWNDSVTGQVEALSTSNTVLDNPEVEDTNNKVDLDLVYNVDSRYLATITKEDLHKATSVLDIVPKIAEARWKEMSLQTVTIAVVQGNDKIFDWYPEMSATGDDKKLNAAQIKLLQSIDYSTNFYIEAHGTAKYPATYTYYFTVIPEKETEFTSGHDALIEYLKERSKEKTAIIKQDKLRPCKVSFIITKKGTVTDVTLTSTSGYPSVDKTMIELITNTPGKWEPAENSKGEKVDQELVFSFGIMGC